MQRGQPKISGLELTGATDEFLDGYRYSGSAKTLALYRDQVERAFGGWMTARKVRMLEDVTPALVRAFLLEEKERLAASTLNRRYGACKTFFTWCEGQGYIQESPFRKVRRPKAPPPSVSGFTQEETRRLVSYAGCAPGWLAARDTAIVTFMLGTGCRAGGLLSLTPASFDWPRKRVLLKEKGLKERWVPLGNKVSATIKAYMKVRPLNPFDSLWLTQRRTVMDYGTLNSMLKYLGKYASVPECRPHRFRHTYASNWYEHHRDIMALKNLLGHSKVETTQRYLHSLGVDYGTGQEYQTPDSWLA